MFLRGFWKTHFIPLVSFYIPGIYQKSSGFLMFSRGVESSQQNEMGKCINYMKTFEIFRLNLRPFKISLVSLKRESTEFSQAVISLGLLGKSFEWKHRTTLCLLVFTEAITRRRSIKKFSGQFRKIHWKKAVSEP